MSTKQEESMIKGGDSGCYCHCLCSGIAGGDHPPCIATLSHLPCPPLGCQHVPISLLAVCQFGRIQNGHCSINPCAQLLAMVCGRDMGSTKQKFVRLCLYTSRGYTGPPLLPPMTGSWGWGLLWVRELMDTGKQARDSEGEL